MPRPVKRELSEHAKAMLREVAGQTGAGSIESRVQQFVIGLETTDRLKLVLAEMAIGLARRLDHDAGPQTASVNKELREVLERLAEESENNDDFLNGLSKPM